MIKIIKDRHFKAIETQDKDDFKYIPTIKWKDNWSLESRISNNLNKNNEEIRIEASFMLDSTSVNPISTISPLLSVLIILDEIPEMRG